MKVVTKKATNVAVYIFPDNVPVVIQDDIMKVGNPENPAYDGYDFYVCDCTTETAALYQNVAAPNGIKPWTHLFDGTTWTPNPDWVDPTPPTS